MSRYDGRIMKQKDVEAGKISHDHQRPCRNCGHPGHAHDRERVYTENGRYHYEYTCPDE